MVPDHSVFPEKVWQGIRLINQQEYFTAHEMLEIAWREEAAPIRRLYQGLLQAGVGYHHLNRKNYSGALKSFEHAHRNLADWLDIPDLPVDLPDVKAQLTRAEEWIRSGARGSILPLVIRYT